MTNAFTAGAIEAIEKLASPMHSQKQMEWARKAVSESDVRGAIKSAWKSAKAEHMSRKPAKGLLKKLKWAVVG